MDQSQEAWIKSPLPFLHQLQELKHLPRTGWLRFVKDCETVASHSWRLALLGLFAPVRFRHAPQYCLTLVQAPLDKQRCMFIGLVHDVAESYAGDIPTFAGFSKGLWSMMPEISRLTSTRQEATTGAHGFQMDRESRPARLPGLGPRSSRRLAGL